jgi:uncharacterized membrane protein YeaQ/YmgE (transglycosylase-associated protein family)
MIKEVIHMDVILWIVFGALAGWIASMIMGNNSSQGWLGNIIVGILGAVVGGWLVGLFAPSLAPANGFNIGSVLVAILGAVVVLFVYNMITGRKTTV